MRKSVFVCSLLYGEGSAQFSVCYERWRNLLWQGSVAAVIKELRAGANINTYR